MEKYSMEGINDRLMILCQYSHFKHNKETIFNGVGEQRRFQINISKYLSQTTHTPAEKTFKIA